MAPRHFAVTAAQVSLARASSRTRAGVTLVELLCVMVIIAILMSLLLPAVARAYNRVRGKAAEIEGPGLAFLVQNEAQKYCLANPRFAFTNKADLAWKCNLVPKCRDWVEHSTTEFVAFDYLTPATQVVMVVHYGPDRRLTWTFTQKALSKPPN